MHRFCRVNAVFDDFPEIGIVFGAMVKIPVPQLRRVGMDNQLVDFLLRQRLFCFQFRQIVAVNDIMVNFRIVNVLPVISFSS